MTKPMKYRDNKSFIFSNECENLFSEPFGISVKSAFLNSLLSFIKKKEINKTEKSPMLNDPSAPTIELSKLGMVFKLVNRSAFCNSFKILIFSDSK